MLSPLIAASFARRAASNVIGWRSVAREIASGEIDLGPRIPAVGREPIVADALDDVLRNAHPGAVERGNTRLGIGVALVGQRLETCEDGGGVGTHSLRNLDRPIPLLCLRPACADRHGECNQSEGEPRSAKLPE